jgi:proteasome assembly chaperone (PAC2) family protein
LDVHGHLWVIDALISQVCISVKKGIEKLQELEIENSKLKLPSKEFEELIRKWGRLA